MLAFSSIAGLVLLDPRAILLTPCPLCTKFTNELLKLLLMLISGPFLVPPCAMLFIVNPLLVYKNHKVYTIFLYSRNSSGASLCHMIHSLTVFSKKKAHNNNINTYFTLYRDSFRFLSLPFNPFSARFFRKNKI